MPPLLEPVPPGSWTTGGPGGSDKRLLTLGWVGKWGNIENPSSCPLIRNSPKEGMGSIRSEGVRLGPADGWVEYGENWRDDGREVELVEACGLGDWPDNENAERSDAWLADRSVLSRVLQMELLTCPIERWCQVPVAWRHAIVHVLCTRVDVVRVSGHVMGWAGRIRHHG